MSARVLVLGGTSEARALCALLAARGVDAIVSLAGVVPQAAPYPVAQRSGGFGGEDGLARYVIAEGITALIDATHPFAAQMPGHAAAAAKASGVAWVMLKRPAWTPVPGDDWRGFVSVTAAVEALPRGARAFLATGAGSLSAAAMRPDCRVILRTMTDPGPVADHVRVIQARPGSYVEDRDLLRDRGVTHVITKNAGGPARGKLDAARDLGIPVHMVARPALPMGRVLRTPEAARDWLDSLA